MLKNITRREPKTDMKHRTVNIYLKRNGEMISRYVNYKGETWYFEFVQIDWGKEYMNIYAMMEQLKRLKASEDYTFEYVYE